MASQSEKSLMARHSVALARLQANQVMYFISFYLPRKLNENSALIDFCLVAVAMKFFVRNENLFFVQP